MGRSTATKSLWTGPSPRVKAALGAVAEAEAASGAEVAAEEAVADLGAEAGEASEGEEGSEAAEAAAATTSHKERRRSLNKCFCPCLSLFH